jgi:acetolactate synthase-1/2/3 large subunit
MFSQPAACLWVAGRYDVPFLTVIYNNGGYRAVQYELRKLYPDGYAVRSGDFNGASLEPSADYTQIAKSCGAYAETVKYGSEVEPALKRALDVVRGGQAAVLDVLLEPASMKGVDSA